MFDGLDFIKRLLGGQAPQQKQIPVGQSIPQERFSTYDPKTRELAQIYNQNPRDPRVAHLDPAMFGYAEDKTVQPPQVRQSLGNVTFNPQQQNFSQASNYSTPIQGIQNPGYVPLQGTSSFSMRVQPAASPEMLKLRNIK